MIVIDASATIALLADSGSVGSFVGSIVSDHQLAYPALMPFEVASGLRSLTARGMVTTSFAATALQSIAQLGGVECPFGGLADRVWQLRDNVSAYDAAYVALAELLDVPLLTLDSRLRAAPGTRCDFVPLPHGS
jgi:predicted nucleic acid-binding protein